LRALVGLLFPHRWQGDLAELKRLLAAEHPSPEGLGPRIDRWLESPGWLVRNAAVKLIAHVRDQERYPRLLATLGDRSEAGIVRRNAAEMLPRIGLRTDAARQALLAALDDSYWEVRTEAARALAALFEPDEELEQALLVRLYGSPDPAPGRAGPREGNFEVRMAIAEGLGRLGRSRTAFAALNDLADDDSWLVRCQAAVGLTQLAHRRPELRAETRERVLAIDRLSEGAVSYFVHRDILSRALQALRKGPDAVPEAALDDLYLSPKAGWNHVRR
jgi:HEAT repeat protein